MRCTWGKNYGIIINASNAGIHTHINYSNAKLSALDSEFWAIRALSTKDKTKSVKRKFYMICILSLSLPQDIGWYMWHCIRLIRMLCAVFCNHKIDTVVVVVHLFCEQKAMALSVHSICSNAQHNSNIIVHSLRIESMRMVFIKILAP